jgi:hypothetical protein
MVVDGYLWTYHTLYFDTPRTGDIHAGGPGEAIRRLIKAGQETSGRVEEGGMMS